ncbi:MAG: ABC transporter ATP-binding protein/permease [Gemmataceae bacterium]|nr:ABC transporter ATP-binding protein/permease [Gemmataceae bacterium]
MEKRAPVARAWSFLNFKPVAKWTALASAVGAGVLYIALLCVLALFADLLVSHGRVPAATELTVIQRDQFQVAWKAIDKDERKKQLQEFKPELDDKIAERLAGDKLADDRADREWQRRACVAQVLADRVGPEAASTYRSRVRTEQPYVGILSTVATTRQQRLIHPIVSALARWNPWIWQADDAMPYLAGLLGAAIVLALLRALTLFAMNYTAALATIEAATRLRRAVYHHTFRHGTLAMQAVGPSEAVGIFTRHVEAIDDMLFAWLTVLVREPLKFALLLIFALIVNFWLAVAFLVFAVLVWLIGGQVRTYSRERGDQAIRSAADQLALLQESIRHIRLVKGYLMELFNQSRVERQLNSHARAALSRTIGEALYQPLLVFLGVLAGASLLYVAGLIALAGQIGMAATIVLVTALVSLYWPLENVREHLRFVRRGRESSVAVFNFLDRPGEVAQSVGAEFLPPLGSLLEFDDVSLREPGTGKLLLRGVTLTVQAGQRVALVGPDELEKHALVYLLPRFLDPTSGEIRIDQHNLRWVTLDSLRAQTAVVLPHNLVFNDTVMNNIGCGDSAYTLPQVIEAAKVAHAHHFIQKLPKGYETPIGEMGHALNIGEQFRIALARAILRDPALVIIEEPPANALDEDTRSVLDDTFTRMLPGRTAIFLPHRLSTLRTCNQVFLLHKGRIEAAGDHRQLLTQSELYHHLHYMEFNKFDGQARE